MVVEAIVTSRELLFADNAGIKEPFSDNGRIYLIQVWTCRYSLSLDSEFFPLTIGNYVTKTKKTQEL